MLDSLLNLAPIIVVIAFFQLAVLQRPLPDLERLQVAAGLALFVRGLYRGEGADKPWP